MAKQEPALREDVLKELEKESRLKEHSGIAGKIITAICLSFTCFQLYTAIFGVLDAPICSGLFIWASAWRWCFS